MEELIPFSSKMVSRRNKLLLAACFLFGVLILSLLLKTQEGFESPQEPVEGLSDCWYINLDRSPDRRKQVEEETKKLGSLPVNRWRAVEGANLKEEDFKRYGIPAWSRPGFAKDEKKRKGELGCAVSHKTLLQHLNSLEAPPDSGHLILEDDIVIEKDMPSAWNKALKAVGSDWDMIFLGLTGNKIQGVKDGIGIPEWITGTHAYAVKHSSIPKILDSLEVIYDPIDEIYGRNQNALKIFALEPNKIKQANQPSTIV